MPDVAPVIKIVFPVVFIVGMVKAACKGNDIETSLAAWDYGRTWMVMGTVLQVHDTLLDTPVE